MSYEFSSPYPGVLWARFDNQTEMALLMCRFQEFFESPKFSGKQFSRDELLAWFKSEYGVPYEEEWGGFNVPGYIIRQINAGALGELTAEESEFLGIAQARNRVYNAGTQYQDIVYLIATMKGDVDTMRHELAHALFYLGGAYQAKVDALISRSDTSDIKNLLVEIGYDGNSQQIMVDEVHAYLMFESKFLQESGIQFDKYLNLADQLLLNFYSAVASKPRV